MQSLLTVSCFRFVFVGLFLLLCFLPTEVPLTFAVKLVWWCQILSSCFCVKPLTSPSVLNQILARYGNLDCRFFRVSTLNISCHSPLVCRVSAERSAVKHMGFPLYVACCFSLAAFNILSLGLVIISLISMHLGMFLLGYILYGALWP